MKAVLLAVCLSASMFACQKPTHEECREICLKGNELALTEKFAKMTEGLSPEEKAEVEKERDRVIKEIKERKHDPGFENCVTDCRQAGNKSDVECVRKAKTSKEVNSCIGG